MTESSSDVVNQNTLTSSPEMILGELPDIPTSSASSMIKVQKHLDLLLLALEALQLGGSEHMLAIAQQLELNEIIHNRLSLWHLRCSNPWRKCYTRESLTPNQAKALTLITIECAKKFMLPIRQLLVAVQQMDNKDMPLENNFRLSQYFTRFKSHFERRMNSRRAKVSFYLSSDQLLNDLALSLLEELVFCTGARGKQRFWISLFDGEVK